MKRQPKPQQKTSRPLRTLLGQRKKKAWLPQMKTRTSFRTHHLIERMSPLMKLANHQQVTPSDHRLVSRRHSSRRTRLLQSPAHVLPRNHNHRKYNLAEDDLLESMCRMDPMSAMLHYFLAAGVDEEQLGDLFLERMPSPIRPAEDEPVPIYTSRTKYSALVLNLGSFARNRKKTAP